MCTHGRGGLKEFLFGSIAQQALQKGTWPILLVPPSAEGKRATFKPARILVPLDGTHRHEPALARAFPIAKAYRAEMHLVMVIPTVGGLSGEGSVPGKFMPRTMKIVLDLAEQNANDYLQQIAGECQNEGVNIITSVLRGETVPKVLDHAAEIAADLIVMASHGKSGLNAFLSGSTAARIAGKAARPLLLVRTGDMEQS
jgi:nucleotide-binding universal stress UspA family protein